MKEKLIQLWERKERYIEETTELKIREIYLSQAFGALEMAMAMTDNWEQEAELVDLWNDEWKTRLEMKAYEMR